MGGVRGLRPRRAMFAVEDCPRGLRSASGSPEMFCCASGSRPPWLWVMSHMAGAAAAHCRDPPFSRGGPPPVELARFRARGFTLVRSQGRRCRSIGRLAHHIALRPRRRSGIAPNLAQNHPRSDVGYRVGIGRFPEAPSGSFLRRSELAGISRKPNQQTGIHIRESCRRKAHPLGRPETQGARCEGREP